MKKQDYSQQEYYLENSGRELNQKYWSMLVNQVFCHVGRKLFVPAPIGNFLVACKSVKYIRNGIRTLTSGKLEVPVLDGTAIAGSILRGDMKTASSVIFLLGIGEILEEWTHKKSVGDLARSMSLNTKKVWQLADGQESPSRWKRAAANKSVG